MLHATDGLDNLAILHGVKAGLDWYASWFRAINSVSIRQYYKQLMQCSRKNKEEILGLSKAQYLPWIKTSIGDSAIRNARLSREVGYSIVLSLVKDLFAKQGMWMYENSRQLLQEPTRCSWHPEYDADLVVLL